MRAILRAAGSVWTPPPHEYSAPDTSQAKPTHETDLQQQRKQNNNIFIKTLIRIKSGGFRIKR